MVFAAWSWGSVKKRRSRRGRLTSFECVGIYGKKEGYTRERE